MSRLIYIFISIIIIVSISFSEGVKLFDKSAMLLDSVISKSNINLTIESNENIYGIKFNIKYNPNEVTLSKKDIHSNGMSANIYTDLSYEGNAQVLMFGVRGEKLLDVSRNRTNNFINIQFESANRFMGTSLVHLSEIIIAGKGGIELLISDSSINIYEISTLIPNHNAIVKNYPNPFHSSTTIYYELSISGMISLVIYDLDGNVVRNLINEYLESNYYNIIWDGLDEIGQQMPSGQYILKMSTPIFSDTITLTLLQ